MEAEVVLGLYLAFNLNDVAEMTASIPSSCASDSPSVIDVRQ